MRNRGTCWWQGVRAWVHALAAGFASLWGVRSPSRYEANLWLYELTAAGQLDGATVDAELLAQDWATVAADARAVHERLARAWGEERSKRPQQTSE